MNAVTDPYQILGVSVEATADEVRAAWRMAARRLHPDVGGSAVEFATARQAYEILSDPIRRSAVDASRCTSCPSDQEPDWTRTWEPAGAGTRPAPQPSAPATPPWSWATIAASDWRGYLRASLVGVMVAFGGEILRSVLAAAHLLPRVIVGIDSLGSVAGIAVPFAVLGAITYPTFRWARNLFGKVIAWSIPLIATAAMPLYPPVLQGGSARSTGAVVLMVAAVLSPVTVKVALSRRNRAAL